MADNNPSNKSAELSEMEEVFDGADGTLCDSYVWDIADIVLFFVGSIGNVLALVIMRRKGLRSKSYAFSLSVLALFNSLTLFVLAIQAGDRLSQRFFSGSLEAHIGTIGCKFYRIALPIVQLMSHWAVVFITTERFVAICFPMALSSLFSGTKSKITLLSLFGAVVISQIWRPFFDIQDTATFGNDSNGTQFEVSPAQCWAEPFEVFQNIDLFYHQLFILCLLPAIFIFVMNAAVIVQIYRIRREIRLIGGSYRGRDLEADDKSGNIATSRSFVLPSASTANGAVMVVDSGGRSLLKSRLNPPQSGNNNGSRTNRKATILLLTVSCSFFVYIAPFVSLLLYIRIFQLINGSKAAFILFSELCVPMKVASLLTTMSYADNFTIFVLTGEKFRKELGLMISKLLATCCPRLIQKKTEKPLRKSLERPLPSERRSV